MNMLNNKSTHLTGQFGQRRQQGNTLVPVIIGLVIAALATLAFLSQGQGLQQDTQRVAAINELVRHVGNSYAAGTGAGYTSLGKNIYAKDITRAANSTTHKIVYTTPDNEICEQIKGVIEKDKLTVTSASCNVAVLTVNIE